MIIRYGITGILAMILVMYSMHISVAQSDLGKIKCVCIDAGHGGKDPGAVGAKVYEKNIVLSIALKLGKKIKETYPDIKVVYVRDKDVFVDLRDRSRIANENKADLFISIHVNSLEVKGHPENRNIKGVETYVLGTNSSDHNLQVAMKENSVIHYEDDYSVKYAGFDPNRVESYILFNMIRNLHLENSVNLATEIQSEVIKTTRQRDRGVRQGPLWVLKDVAMPAVLVEVGFITNAEDERFMMSSAGQDKLVKSIFSGFNRYKEKFEAKTVIPQKQLGSKEESMADSIVVGKEKPVYAVQIASTSSCIKNCKTLCCDENVKELYVDGRYRYYVGESEDWKQAQENLNRVKRKVKDCFLIAIYKGNLISVGEAQKLK